MGPNILVINPGSTSTKVALFDSIEPVRAESLHHKAEDLNTAHLTDQLPMRWASVSRFLQAIDRIDVVVARGGLLRPLESGVWSVNADMLSDLHDRRYGEHASNLGAFLAKRVADERKTLLGPIIVDPVVVDEFDDVARISGHRLIERRSVFHALNQKAVARNVCKKRGLDYSTARLVVAHLGGGVTIGVHRFGRVVDVNSGIDGEGPMTPERPGALPVSSVIGICEEEDGLEKISRALRGRGGFVAHVGTNDFRTICARAETDESVELLVRAFSYQVAKEIGGAAAALDGEVDAIVLTGGLAHSKWLCDLISQRVALFAPVDVLAGEDEMRALAESALRVLGGNESPREYRKDE